MASWPTELQQEPNVEGFSQRMKPNTIRSNMEYGPDKIRRRTKQDWYDVTITIWCDMAQMAVFDQFYRDNMTLTWDWLNFNVEPFTAATYRFVGVPNVSPMGPLYRVVTMTLEMES